MSLLPPKIARMIRPRYPLLDNGDRMKAAEFEARYSAMPHVRRADLLNGVVYLSSPVRQESHAAPHGIAVTWLGNYCMLTPGVNFGDNGTIRLDDDNQPQSDVCLRIPAAAGGQSTISDDDYVTGAPELVCEVAASSRSFDLGVKKDVYARFGVREYVVWQVEENGIDWFVLRNGQYVSVDPDPDDLFRSAVFPGLWLDWKALLTGDLAGVFAALQQGCAAPEHQAFVQRLAQSHP
ncbi:MAG TPA: Uma2 family endonuclease [Gemmataceae bacterium]|jgi:Uma2 family endonuclease|nr:Uma2 family endonuclease [Gemmataceae bacterium]